MNRVAEIILDAARSSERIVALATPGELERLLILLRGRRFGTLYLMASGDRFFIVGVAARTWLAGIGGGSEEPLWLSNPPANRRGGATFDCSNTPTRIEARFTCRESDAIPACRGFFLDPDGLPPGNWVGEWSGLPTRTQDRPT